MDDGETGRRSRQNHAGILRPDRFSGLQGSQIFIEGKQRRTSLAINEPGIVVESVYNLMTDVSPIHCINPSL